MTLILRADTVGEVSDKAERRLSDTDTARFISIDSKRHRLELKRHVRASPSVIIQTQQMFTGDEVADLVTFSLRENDEQRSAARKSFTDFLSTCKADNIVWICPVGT